MEELIKVNTAKLAKEKGLEYLHQVDDEILLDFPLTQSQLQTWLRHNHNIHIFLDPADKDNWGVIYGIIDGDYEWIYEESEEDIKYFKTFEEGLEAGLLRALELIK